MNFSFNDRLKQLLILFLIILLGWMLITQLYIFLPGLLGGITLYILSRNLYFKLIFKRKWKKGGTALLFMLGYIVIISLPVYLCVKLVTPKINYLVNNQGEVIAQLNSISLKIKNATGVELINDESATNLTKKATAFIPIFLNSTLNIITNLIMMFFLMYYLLVNGKAIERYLNKIIPLKQKNVDTLARETKVMIKANALGIPIICFVQGAFAALGYWIFGVKDWGMWGFVTGVFAFFPIVGTMIVWIPLVIIQAASGQSSVMVIGLTLYSIVVTGNVDYITRLGLLKKLGNVHPMVTVLGVIVGLGLFGFMGLIFGPLLVSYFIILVKIYMNEFNEPEESNNIVHQREKQ